MLDQIGALFATAIYAAQIGVLVRFSEASAAYKRIAMAGAVVWGGTIAVVAAAGGFTPGAAGPIPAPVLPFAALLALLFGGWFLVPRFRSVLLAVPLPALIGLNAARLGGVFFLLLAADGRLSATFATAAGVGDMIVGALAVPLVLVALRRAGESATWLSAWNAFGVLDLIVAISLGMLSAPGTPFRVFTDGPGTLAMTGLPWIMVPAALVPIYFLIHLTVAAKLRALQPVTPEVVMAR